MSHGYLLLVIMADVDNPTRLQQKKKKKKKGGKRTSKTKTGETD